LLLVVSTASCSKETATSPSSTDSSSPSSPVTERFDGIIDLRDSAFYAFTVNQNGGTVSIDFASLSPLNRPGLLSVTMEIGYGVPAGEGCDLRRVMQVAPALTSQLTETLTAGIYCVSIVDIGAMTEAANFAIRISHP
jgi:hypothetical protein